MESSARLAALLEALPGVKDAVLCNERGRPLESAGIVGNVEEVAAATAVTVDALKTAGQQLLLGALQKAIAKGPSAVQVIAAQPGAVVSVQLEAKRATADLEVRLADPRWATPRETIVAKPVGAPRPVPAPSRSEPPVVAAEGARVQRAAPPRETGFTGQLSLFALPELLEFLRGGQRTGRLHLGSDAGGGGVRLRRGKITWASSPGASSIGGYLVAGGVLTPAQLHEALEAQHRDPQRRHLGRLLIDQRLANAADIRGALVAQVHDAVRELKDWIDGHFTFEPEQPGEPSLADIELELDPQGVLLTVFKEEDERQRDAR